MSVSHGDAGIGRHRHRGGYAGNHLKGNTRLGQGLGFFSSPAKDKGIAALEAHHRKPGPGFLDEQFIDAFLGHGVGPGLFPHVDDLCARRHLGQQGKAGQLVIDHHLGLPQHLQALHGDQARIPGPGADQVNHTNNNITGWKKLWGRARDSNSCPPPHTLPTRLS